MKVICTIRRRCIEAKDGMCGAATPHDPRYCEPCPFDTHAECVDCIDGFDDEYCFLSNFYPRPVVYDSKIYPTPEHLYQCFKTLDMDAREDLRQLPTAGQAKRMGSKLVMRPDWEEMKIKFMKSVVDIKFAQSVEFRQLLVRTGDKIIVESNNWHDNFWGNCNCLNCHSIYGANHLGYILMNKRTELLELYPEERMVND